MTIEMHCLICSGTDCTAKPVHESQNARQNAHRKLQVSFAEYRLFYRSLLQKETCNFKEPTNRSHSICVKMHIEILNGGEILVPCNFNLNQNLNLNLYRKIERNSNESKIALRICTARYQGIRVSRF